MESIQRDAKGKQVPLGLYLWTRIGQLGTQSIMGVPGDMNLELLDYIKEVKGLSWVGNANELNAAYAADGYARTKGCPGVLSTTMGVGEISALNGVAGAFTEQVKLIHVVGTTTTSMQVKRLMIHHCLGSSPDHRAFDKISRLVRCAHTWIDDRETAAAEIDRVLRECIIQSLPVYIFVPMDFVHTPVSAERLKTPIDLSHPCNLENEKNAIEHIVEAVSKARNPCILADVLAHRHGAVQETRALAQILNFPYFSTPYGKGILNEDHPQYCGTYNGAVSQPGVKTIVEGSDCIINVGPLLSDSNTGGHTREIQPDRVILINPSNCTVFGHDYPDVYLKPLLKKLVKAFQGVRVPSVEKPALPPKHTAADTDGPEIVQSWIWKRIGSFTRPGDVVIVESGTAQFGFPDATLANDVKYITQGYFGSIGYATPACLGAALAQREIQAVHGGIGRTILIVGDGSLQLTVQEIGTMIRHKLNPLLLVINNGGYTIERAIHGPEEVYNDISSWRHQLMLEFFGAPNARDSSREVRTRHALEEVLAAPAYTAPQSIQLLEIYMGIMDVPWQLAQQIALVNARKEQAQHATNVLDFGADR